FLLSPLRLELLILLRLFAAALQRLGRRAPAGRAHRTLLDERLSARAHRTLTPTWLSSAECDHNAWNRQKDCDAGKNWQPPPAPVVSWNRIGCEGFGRCRRRRVNGALGRCAPLPAGDNFSVQTIQIRLTR